MYIFNFDISQDQNYKKLNSTKFNNNLIAKNARTITCIEIINVQRKCLINFGFAYF